MTVKVMEKLLELFQASTQKPNERVFQINHHHHWFSKLIEKLEIENFRFHDLRHTFCSRLVRAKIPPVLGAKLAGHSKMDTFYRYVHLEEEDYTAAANALNQMREGNG